MIDASDISTGTSPFKRAFDVVVSATVLLLLAPVMAIAALLIAFNMGTPVIFKQPRPGYKGKTFTIYKFRSMRDAEDKTGRPLPDSERLTRLGAFLRASSVDELPELFNVLKGDMSLVGPRPLRTDYLARYSPEQARRHDVLPGITGWAQVNGRNSISWEDKFKLDVWYVDNQNLVLDVKILFLTFLKVFNREGISADGHTTMPDFMGSKEK